MATIITRAGKGAPLTNNEMDANLTNINNQVVAVGGVASATSATVGGLTGTVDGHTATLATLTTAVATGGFSTADRTKFNGIAAGATANGPGTITGTSSGTNTGDQVLPTLASLGAQAALVSGTSIKTINGDSVLGAGNIKAAPPGLPVITVSGGYTITPAAVNKHIVNVSTVPNTITIQAGGFAPGDAITISNWFGAGELTVALASGRAFLAGGTLEGSRKLKGVAVITYLNVDWDNWICSGAGVT